jgi:glycosyltransferase involved in cell wall biosynthesis
MLASIAWADEILVIDMQSEDDTTAIAATAGARVIETPIHARVDAVRTKFLSAAKHEWILVLDSDEYLADDAKTAIEALLARHGEDVDAFAVPRFNWFGDRLLEGTGWYPDRQIRLFRKGAVEWADATHRGPFVVTGHRGPLLLDPPNCLHIHHSNYTDLGHVIAKQADYARNDIYPDDPALFRFEEYIAEAFVEYRGRLDREHDGDYSVALATIMAWDKIMRGLVHWDRLGRKSALPDIFSMPVVLTPRGNFLTRRWRALKRRPRRWP